MRGAACELSDHPQGGLGKRGGVCGGKRRRLMCDCVANAPGLRECRRNFRAELRVGRDAYCAMRVKDVTMV